MFKHGDKRMAMFLDTSRIPQASEPAWLNVHSQTERRDARATIAGQPDEIDNSEDYRGFSQRLPDDAQHRADLISHLASDKGQTLLERVAQASYDGPYDGFLKPGYPEDIQDLKAMVAEPLTLAAATGNLEMCREYINRGEDVRVNTGNAPLKAAVSNGHNDICKELLIAGADANQGVRGQDNGHQSVLHIAMRQENYDCAKLLLENGADVNATDNHYETPLHIAAGQHSGEMMDYLISHGADTSMKDRFGAALDEPGAKDALDSYRAFQLNAQLEANTAQVPSQVPSFPDLNDPATLDQIAASHAQEPKRRGMRL
jgi:hypothetical protein